MREERGDERKKRGQGEKESEKSGVVAGQLQGRPAGETGGAGGSPDDGRRPVSRWRVGPPAPQSGLGKVKQRARGREGEGEECGWGSQDQGVSGPSSSCVWNPRVFADDEQWEKIEKFKTR